MCTTSAYQVIQQRSCSTSTLNRCLQLLCVRVLPSSSSLHIPGREFLCVIKQGTNSEVEQFSALLFCKTSLLLSLVVHQSTKFILFVEDSVLSLLPSHPFRHPSALNFVCLTHACHEFVVCFLLSLLLLSDIIK